MSSQNPRSKQRKGKAIDRLLVSLRHGYIQVFRMLTELILSPTSIPLI